MGDSEEHAMLLCNYFNYIDKQMGRQPTNENDKNKKNYQSYIVYGDAVPNGECWFVIRRDCINNFVELWNPMNGECYNFDREVQKKKGVFGENDSVSMNQRAFDPVCPLKKVWCIIG